MKIAMFSDTYVPEINGVASSVAILANKLREHGHIVYVVTTKPNKMAYEDDPFVIRLEGIELKQLYGYTLTSPIHLQVYEIVKSLDLDVIHCHTEFSVGILAHTCAKYLHIPLVSTYHTTYEDYTHYVNVLDLKSVDYLGKKVVKVASKVFLKSSMAVISPSNKTKDLLLHYGVKAPIHVIPTGLDLARFSKARINVNEIEALKEKYNLHDRKIILYVGRIAQEKSLDLVINCFADLIKSDSNYQLVIVGKGPGLDELVYLTQSLNIEDYVTFTGAQQRELLPSFYHMAHLFVSASLSETQGVTFIEALASQTPIIARKDEVLNDLLIPNETGYFFSDSASFIDAVRSYEALDDSQRAMMMDKCTQVVQPYDDETFYQAVLGVYLQVVDRYLDCYVLKDISTKDEFMLCHFENRGHESRDLLVSLEDYMDKGLRKGLFFTDNELDELKESEYLTREYHNVLKYLGRKERTVKEVYDYFTNNTNLTIEQINRMMEVLESKGYVNDEKYVINTLYSMKASLFGKEKIKKSLKSKGISMDLINMYLENENEDEEFANAMNFAKNQQFLALSKSQSLKAKQKRLYDKLLLQGYTPEISEKVIESIDFTSEMRNESSACLKTAEKAKRIYSKNYDDSALRNKVFNYCLNKGFDYSDIYSAIDMMEWEDD